MTARLATAEEAAALAFGDDISDRYDTGFADGRYWAFCLTSGPYLEADTLAELNAAIHADRRRLGHAR